MVRSRSFISRSRRDLILFAGNLSAACLTLLLELLQPIHGVVRATAAMLFRPMTQGLLGLNSAGGKTSSKQAARGFPAVRAQILAFIQQALRFCTLDRSPKACGLPNCSYKTLSKCKVSAYAV